MESQKQYNRLLERFENPGVPISECIKELKDAYKVSGVRDFIINKLYKYNDADTMFYLPQLCYLYVSDPTDSITKYLLDKCTVHFSLCFCIIWCVKSYAHEMMLKDKYLKKDIESFLAKCESNMINNPKKRHEDINNLSMIENESQLDDLDSKLEKNQKFIIRREKAFARALELKVDHHKEMTKIVNVLTDFSLHLKKNGEESERKEMGRTFLKNVNARLWQRKFMPDKQKLNPSDRYLLEGVIFPFSPTEKGEMSCQIVRIVYREVTCFNTKKRVPYRMVVETIDPKELENEDPSDYYHKDVEYEYHQYSEDSNRNLEFEKLIKEIKEETITEDMKNDAEKKIDVVRLDQFKKFTKEIIDKEEEKRIQEEQENEEKNKLLKLPKNLTNWFKKNLGGKTDDVSVNDSPTKKDEIAESKEENVSPTKITQSHRVIVTKPSLEQSVIVPEKKSNEMLKKTLMRSGEINSALVDKNRRKSNIINPSQNSISKKGNEKKPLDQYKRFSRGTTLASIPETQFRRSEAVKATKKYKEYISKSCEKFNCQETVNNKLEFFRKVIFSKEIFPRIKKTIQTNLSQHYEELCILRIELIEKDKEVQNNAIKEKKENGKVVKKGLGPWDVLWEYKEQDIRNESPYSRFESYRIRSIIIKGGDDLRQEIICMQIIKKLDEIWKKEGTSLFVRPYEIIVTGPESGVLEFVTDSISIDGLKKKYKGMSLLKIYKHIFGHEFMEAQKNFAESLAAYSIIAYILQIKDRHNGNLLITSKGHFVHIDFGFILTTSPGGINFESAPFKFTQDYLDLQGGIDSPIFGWFKILMFQGFKSMKNYVEEICSILNVMRQKSTLTCFEKFDMEVFKGRFKIQYDDTQLLAYIDGLIKDSMIAKRTIWYDDFQKMTNKIEP